MRWLRGSVVGAVLLMAVGCTGGPAAVDAPAPPASSARTTAAPPPVTASALAPSSTASTRPAPSAVRSSRSAAPSTPSPTRRSTAPSSSASVSPAEVAAPGPDDGPPCAVDPQYSDEPPTGLRADVLAGWVAVKKYAAARGVTLCLNDGKRSTAQQLALFQDYVRRYGRAAANDYVLPPAKSAHVKGYAVDVQPAAAYRWLQATNGARSWCRIHDNEPWHFEYSRTYQRSGCPARLPKPVR